MQNREEKKNSIIGKYVNKLELYPEALVFDIPENLEDYTILQRKKIDNNIPKPYFNLRVEVNEVGKESKVINLNQTTTKEEWEEFITYLNKCIKIREFAIKEADKELIWNDEPVEIEENK